MEIRHVSRKMPFETITDETLIVTKLVLRDPDTHALRNADSYIDSLPMPHSPCLRLQVRKQHYSSATCVGIRHSK
jgi:hypothetical protein